MGTCQVYGTGKNFLLLKITFIIFFLIFEKNIWKQEENTELREKMEDLEDNIGIEQERKKAAEEKLASRNKLLVGIREGLDHLVQTLVS